VAILLEMRKGTLRRIDGQVGEVGPAKPFQLGVETGEVPALQQRIIAEVDARRHVLGHEADLLGLREEVVGHAESAHLSAGLGKPSNRGDVPAATNNFHPAAMPACAPGRQAIHRHGNANASQFYLQGGGTMPRA